MASSRDTLRVCVAGFSITVAEPSANALFSKATETGPCGEDNGLYYMGGERGILTEGTLSGSRAEHDVLCYAGGRELYNVVDSVLGQESYPEHTEWGERNAVFPVTCTLNRQWGQYCLVDFIYAECVRENVIEVALLHRRRQC
jgi:hypothetical protein